MDPRTEKAFRTALYMVICAAALGIMFFVQQLASGTLLVELVQSRYLIQSLRSTIDAQNRAIAAQPAPSPPPK